MFNIRMAFSMKHPKKVNSPAVLYTQDPIPSTRTIPSIPTRNVGNIFAGLISTGDCGCNGSK